MDKELVFPREFFSASETLSCGQTFRFTNFRDGFLVKSKDEACYIYEKGDETHFSSTNNDYFYNYFDLDRDYSKIAEKAYSYNNKFLTMAVDLGKGIRILKQDSEEMLFSFLISQNNHIPRIKAIIERICDNLGDKKEFMQAEFYSFPKAKKFAEMSEDFFLKLGSGYRARYLFEAGKKIESGFEVEALKNLSDEDARKSLMGILGVGRKVCDCVMLFGLNRTNAFPVDTWIEKIYYEEFNDIPLSRSKITEYFENEFKEYSGFIQQYLFNYRRNKID